MYILHSFQLSFVLSELTQQFAISISHIYFNIYCWQIMPAVFISSVVLTFILQHLIYLGWENITVVINAFLF